MAKKIHISEDEQLEKVKKWWKENGTGVVTGIVLGLGLIIGYNWWQKNLDSKALQASTVFSQLLDANEAEEADKVAELGAKLKSDFSSTDYAAKGVILSAISQIKAGNAEQGKDDLQWVIDNSKLTDNQLLAKYKLARQHYREGGYDQALALVEIEDKAGFSSQYFELIGDINNKQGNLKQAQEAYQKAMEAISPETASSGYREILQLKINNTAT